VKRRRLIIEAKVMLKTEAQSHNILCIQLGKKDLTLGLKNASKDVSYALGVGVIN
jgi:hypothetical protein